MQLTPALWLFLTQIYMLNYNSLLLFLNEYKKFYCTFVLNVLMLE